LTLFWPGPYNAAHTVSKTRRKSIPEDVSDLITSRLSVYLQCLNTLEAAGISTVSSSSLAQQFHLNAAQIRKDLACFGEFGVRGVGYSVQDLRQHLRGILGLNQQLRVGIIGAGNLGLALADYPGFRHDGFEIVALFDSQPEKIGGESRGGVPIYDVGTLADVARRDKIRLAVIAVPAHAAQRVADLVVSAGIKGLLSFSPGPLNVPRTVKLKTVDLTVSLESLSYHLAKRARKPA
jgi:redox-sensing transcriptional repressor